MGEVIQFPVRRSAAEFPATAIASEAAETSPRAPKLPDPEASPRLRTRFFFDLACPFSYLAIERVESTLPNVEWVPAAGGALRPARRGPGYRGGGDGSLLARAERLADELRLPLVWPEHFNAGVPAALRAAAWAQEEGLGGRFAVAASRLAFCGGYDLDDPIVLADAAHAAGLDPRGALLAAEETERDEAIMLTGLTLREHGVRRLPAFRLGGRWYSGQDALAALRPEFPALSSHGFLA